MKSLLAVTAIFEAFTGLALMAVPALVVSLLLGTTLDGTGAMIVARIAGAALVSLAIACWLSRNNAAASTVVKAMLFYNCVAGAVLLYGVLGLKLSGLGLVPAFLLHVGFAVWCFWVIQKKKTS